jgi:hypothetical protein
MEDHDGSDSGKSNKKIGHSADWSVPVKQRPDAPALNQKNSYLSFGLKNATRIVHASYAFRPARTWQGKPWKKAMGD